MAEFAKTGMNSGDKPILLIEDDAAIRESLVEVLQFDGFTVVCANNGEEGLATLQKMEVPPGLILLDVMMPVMDGYECLKRLRSNPQWSDIPVTLLSADGALDKKAAHHQVTRYLKKPVELNDLLDLVKDFC